MNTLKITFTGGPYRKAEVCLSDFHAIEELIGAGYIILNVEAV